MSNLKRIMDSKRAKLYIQQFEQYLVPTLTEKKVDVTQYAIKLFNYGKIITYQEKGIVGYYLDQKYKKCFISILSVMPEHQSHGIGRYLMEQVEFDAKKNQLICLQLAVEKENLGGIRFYERHGFTYLSESNSQYLYTKKIC